uniref:Death domain-containing protein n=1 Tax=Glossina brevipalpis TaxID=37001 RepID=A0A1A9WG22_9MUSC
MTMTVCNDLQEELISNMHESGPSRAQWEDVTGSTPLTFVNDCVSFTTTVSARFWLMDCRNISEATKMATELYKEVIHVPFIAKFVVFAKKVEPYEARLRVFCMTDDREDKTLEKLELFTQVAKSRDVEVLESKPQYIEMAGNLVPVTKSGEQLQLPFKAFRENRLPFTVRVKDQHADIVGRTLFMKEPKVAKGEPPQHPICILNIVLPETVIPDSTTAFSDKITSTYRSSLLSFSKHQNDHYIGDIRIVDLSNLLGKDWIRLATEIGISIEEIDEIINQNTDSIARQAQSMIRLYKDKPNYDICLLEVALKNIGRDDIMNKCKSGRLSHSRDFDDTDIMKNSESVEELVRLENKRIQQINESEEVKYSAEEKEIEESESDEELAKQTVAERREKIVKRLSVERQIPASSQKKEITREITEIKRKSLIEDKKAMHESEIFMQLPADNSVKSTVVSEHVIKMKLGKKDSSEVSKSDFDKELTYKFKTSSRSSEETDDSTIIDQKSLEDVDNLKIIKDLSSVEKTSKISDFILTERPATTTDVKKLTEDFVSSERLPEQYTQPLVITEKFTEEFKEKVDNKTKVNEELKETAEQMVKTTVEKASKKVESIISVFEAPQSEKTITKEITIQLIPKQKEKIEEIQTDKKLITWETEEHIQGKVDNMIDEKLSIKSKSTSVKDKIKTFTEQKVDDESLKEALVTGTKKVSETVKVFSLPKVDDFKQSSADILHKQFVDVEDKLEDFKTTTTTTEPKEKIIDSTSVTITELTDPKIQEQVSEHEGLIIVLTESIKDTAKSFAVSDIKDKITDTKLSFLEDKVHDLKTHSIEDISDHVVTDAKIVEDTLKSTTESLGRDLPKKPDEIKEKIDDAVVSGMKSVEDTVQVFTKDKFDDLKGKADEVDNGLSKIKTFATEKVDDLKSTTIEIKEKLIETKEPIKMETKTVRVIIKGSIESKSKDLEEEIKEIFVDSKDIKDTIESKTEDVKTKVSQMEDVVKETKVSFTTRFLPETERISDDIESKSMAITIPSEISELETKFIEDKISLPEDKIVSTETILQQIPIESVKVDEKIISRIEEITPATAPEDATFRDSIDKLEEMKSIVVDARKITQDFLGTEQHSRIPIPTKLKKEIKTTETTKKETFSFPTTIEKDVVLMEKLTKASEQTKIPIKEVTKVITDQSKDKLKTTADYDERPPSVGESVKIKTIETVTFKNVHETIKKPMESVATVTAKEVIVTAPIELQEKTEKVIKDAITIAKDSELIGTVQDITQDDVLIKEEATELLQREELITPAPFGPRKSLTDAEFCKSVQETITKKMSEGLIEISDELQLKVLIGYFPFDSLSALFEKHFTEEVQSIENISMIRSPRTLIINLSETIYIYIGSDIPPSQTPPPTPIDTKSERQEREEIILEKTLIDEEQLSDTVKTLHKTTESTFERISTTTRIVL